MRTIVHAAAFFSDKVPEYRASFTRAETCAGIHRACNSAHKKMWREFPDAVSIRVYSSAYNASAPAGFLRAPPYEFLTI